jgi:endonuclease YncB( thermonuclease family)
MKLLLALTFFLFTQIQALEITEVLRVYDGDTIYVNLSCNEPIFCKNIGIRLKGIDTPEIRTRNKREKRLGYSAKAYLEGIVSKATYFELRDVSRGKYFRVIADVLVNGMSLSEIMISSGYAKHYHGGSK